MIKTCIVGYGRIADAPAEAISLIQGYELVGVCDNEELMAKKLYERFKVKRYFHYIHERLDVSRPDVVHIITPPQRHFELGRICLKAGSHVYIEKSFAVNSPLPIPYREIFLTTKIIDSRV